MTMFPPKKPEPKVMMEQSAPQTPIGMLRSTPQTPISSERSAPQIPNYTGPSPKIGPHQWGSTPNYSPTSLSRPPTLPPPGVMRETSASTMGMDDFLRSGGNPADYNTNDTPTHNQNGLMAEHVNKPSYVPFQGNTSQFGKGSSGPGWSITEPGVIGTPPWVNPSTPPPVAPVATSPIMPNPAALESNAPESMSNQLLSGVRKPGLQKLPTWFK